MSGLVGRLGGSRRGGGGLDVAALDARCAGLAAAAEAAQGRLPAEPVAAARAVLERAGQRRALAPDLTVVALAGATGAGKSSLFNALVGADVAGVAATRPTTAEPTAALWTSPSHAAGLLEWLGVARWHVVDESPAPDAAEAGLVLLDLPDHDSTQASHRATVDHLVARVDAMVWVLDPQKYADALVHDAYLARFARHAEVTIVLLNQVDRLAPEDARACLAHLRELLAADGLADARTLGVSATTGAGLAELRVAVGEVVAAKQAALARLAADVAGAAEALRVAAADPGSSLRPVPRSATGALTEALVEASGVRLVEEAVRGSVRVRGARATGWVPLRWVHRLRSDPAARLRLGRPQVDPAVVRTSLPSASPVAMARVGDAARAYAATASQGAPASWVRTTRAVAARSAEGIGPHLDAAVARADLTSPRPPRWWSLASGLQWAFLLVSAAGALWLLGLVGLAALALPAPDPPTVGGLPVPTALLLGGIVVGLALALLARLAVRGSARRAGRRARAAVSEQVAQVARARIADPVAEELGSLEAFRVGLVAAEGG